LQKPKLGSPPFGLVVLNNELDRQQINEQRQALLQAMVQEVIRRLESGDMQSHSVNDNRTKDGRIGTGPRSV